MTPRPGGRRWAALLAATALAAVVLLMAGCEAMGYYAQSIGGHLGVMAQAQPLTDAIASARDANDARLAGRLALAGRMREFASGQPKLPEHGI